MARLMNVEEINDGCIVKRNRALVTRDYGMCLVVCHFSDDSGGILANPGHYRTSEAVATNFFQLQHPPNEALPSSAVDSVILQSTSSIDPVDNIRAKTIFVRLGQIQKNTKTLLLIRGLDGFHIRLFVLQRILALMQQKGIDLCIC